MASELVLPTLTAFTSSHLTAILTAKTTADFNTAFDAFFASNLNVTFNGTSISREQYQAQLLSQSSAANFKQGARLTVQDQLEVPGNQGQLSGLVGLFYTSLVDSKFMIMGAPAENKVTSSINVIIQPTEKPPQSNPRIHGYFDPRRVVTVNQIATDLAVQVTIPAKSVNSNTPGVTMGPGPVVLDPIEANASSEQFPGCGMFGVSPVMIPGETIGEATRP